MLTWWMIILLFIYVVICFLLMAAILLQSGKGGGLSSLAGASGGISDAIGATGAEKTMNKITSGVAISFMLLAIVLSLVGRYVSPANQPSEIFGEKQAPAAETVPAPEPGNGMSAPPEPILPAQAPELPVPAGDAAP